MKCAVIGGSVLPPSYFDRQGEQCGELGKWMARAGIVVLTGACTGYPYLVSKGAVSAGGEVIGYSPAKNAEEHLNVYGYPNDAVSRMVYLDEFPENSMVQRMLARSLPLMEDCDVALCLEGSWGTLMELVCGVCMDKPVIAVREFGGVGARFEMYFHQLQAECQHGFASELIVVDTLDEARDQLMKIKEKVKERGFSLPSAAEPPASHDDRPDGYIWEWIQYPHGNQELVERKTDACLEQMDGDGENHVRFLLSLRNEDNSQNHWCIVLEDGADPNWFDALKSRANEILDNPEAYSQFDL